MNVKDSVKRKFLERKCSALTPLRESSSACRSSSRFAAPSAPERRLSLNSVAMAWPAKESALTHRSKWLRPPVRTAISLATGSSAATRGSPALDLAALLCHLTLTMHGVGGGGGVVDSSRHIEMQKRTLRCLCFL